MYPKILQVTGLSDYDVRSLTAGEPKGNQYYQDRVVVELCGKKIPLFPGEQNNSQKEKADSGQTDKYINALKQRFDKRR